MCFSPHALYSAPVSLCSSKQLWGKTPRNPGTLTLRTRTGGKLSDLFFFSPGVTVSIDSDICFKPQIQHGRTGEELSHGDSFVPTSESLPTVGGQVLCRSTLRRPCRPSPSQPLCPASGIPLTFAPSEEQDLVHLHVFLRARDFWVSSQHSLLNKLLGCWKGDPQS